MLYCSQDMVHDRCNCYFSFWAIFGAFTQKKSKFLKNEKNTGDIIILHMCTKNYDQMIHGSWDMVHNRLTDRQMEKWMEKVAYRVGYPTQKCLEISSFYICVPKIMIRWCTVPEIWCAMDGQMDGWTDGKSDIEVGAPPNNLCEQYIN